jgi:hypothetical protein
MVVMAEKGRSGMGKGRVIYVLTKYGRAFRVRPILGGDR